MEYCIQQTPEYRAKPFGTTHVLLAAKEHIDDAFLFMNGDDLYGQDALQKMWYYMSTSENPYSIAAYELNNVLNDTDPVNRGIITEDNGSLTSIQEYLGISTEDIPGSHTGEESVSMNLFGLHAGFLKFAQKEFDSFLDQYAEDPEKELFLPSTISDFLAQTKTTMKVLSVDDTWQGLTYPEDVEVLRQKLANDQ